MNYDVFISFKHLDEQGNATEDFKIATETYQFLTEKGYKVFFSAKTLATIGSSRYKSDIDSALDTAKVMIVVLTKAEYASAQWVQYEWDSYYSDYLSGVRKDIHLFTLLSGVNASSLPRTLRNLQSFDYNSGLDSLLEYIKPIIEKADNKIPNQSINTASAPTVSVSNNNDTHAKFSVLTANLITPEIIQNALNLDRILYPDDFQVSLETCLEWYNVNPDIFVMIKDNQTGNIVGVTNVSPVTEECYERIKKGDFIDTGITSDMLLSYDMPFPYCVYFSSIAVHPDYQNTQVFLYLFNALVDKFLQLGEREIYVKKMLADAVSPNGEKFCKLFGMTKVKDSEHQSTLYEVTMIPPKFRVMSKKTKELYDYYLRKYNEEPYLFEE